MDELLIAFVTFICLVSAAALSLFLYGRLPAHHRQQDTHEVVKLAGSLFVVMTSLVIGLMISSAKSVFENADRNVHTFATELILFDRMLRQYGPDAGDARQKLITYTRRASDGTWNESDNALLADRTSERLLGDVGDSLNAIRAADDRHDASLHDIEQQFRKVVEQRWILLEQADGTIPTPLIAMLVVWLMLIFASFGYRAPRNPVVVATFVISAALVSGALYLIMDMDRPLEGPIHLSSAPLERAFAEMER